MLLYLENLAYVCGVTSALCMIGHLIHKIVGNIVNRGSSDIQRSNLSDYK